MRIACASDLHGFLPEIPDCDVCVLSGDYMGLVDHVRDQDGEIIESAEIAGMRIRNQQKWFEEKFRPWVAGVSKTCEVIGVAGNHDRLLECDEEYARSLDWTYLKDEGCVRSGLRFWGMPWSLRFGSIYSFNAHEGEVADACRSISGGADVVLSHGPAYGVADESPGLTKGPAGSRALRVWVEENAPRLLVHGHIHGGHGRHQIDDTIVINASLRRDCPAEGNWWNQVQTIDLD